MIQRFVILSLCAGALLAAGPSSAADFGDVLKDTVERAAKSEVQRKVDRETRKATRCALGDTKCEIAEGKDNEDNADDGAAANVDASVAANAAAHVDAGADPGGDHPLIAPYQGSVRKTRSFEAFNEYLRIVGRDGKATKTERLEGKLTRIRYDNPKGRSTFEIERNYRDALTARGFRVDYECAKRAVCGTTARPGWQSLNGINLGIAGDVRYFTGKLAYGSGEAFVSVAVNPQVTYVHVLETAAMDRDMVAVDADALAAGLEKDGRVRLDGIFFDTGKAQLKPTSNPALDQAAQLLRQQASLKLLIAGHTDNTGSDAANRTLSQQRAEAVRNALLARGVAADRLTAQGFGSGVPVADNASEAGRAQNRRVELVKQ